VEITRTPTTGHGLCLPLNLHFSSQNKLEEFKIV
jgi:hypothetical protein